MVKALFDVARVRGVHGLEARATELTRLNLKSYQSGIVMVKG
jgi:hypothetical protein